MTKKGVTVKKRVAVSYKNLSEALKEEVRKKYPNGYADHMIRIDKGPGDFFYAVVLETEEICYLIKVDVKIDDKPDEEEEKDYFDDDQIKDAEEVADDADAGEKMDDE